MTTLEAQAKKAQLEVAILKLCREFEGETALQVSKIDLIFYQSDYVTTPILDSVKVEAKL